MFSKIMKHTTDSYVMEDLILTFHCDEKTDQKKGKKANIQARFKMHAHVVYARAQTKSNKTASPETY